MLAVTLRCAQNQTAPGLALRREVALCFRRCGFLHKARNLQPVTIPSRLTIPSAKCPAKCPRTAWFSPLQNGSAVIVLRGFWRSLGTRVSWQGLWADCEQVLSLHLAPGALLCSCSLPRSPADTGAESQLVLEGMGEGNLKNLIYATDAGIYPS